MKDVLFFDLEVDSHSNVRDIGAWYAGAHFHGPDISKFKDFLTTGAANTAFICGHNIINHDIPLLEKTQLNSELSKRHIIDTLYLSALLFPQNPYHKLVKDYKLVSEEPNNPVSDCKVTMRLLTDIIRQFQRLDNRLKTLYHFLLHDLPPFKGFFHYVEANNGGGWDTVEEDNTIIEIIKKYFDKKMCTGVDFREPLKNNPLELANALALVNTRGFDSVSPPWLVHRYPGLLQILHRLRFNRCRSPECTYCHTQLDAGAALKRIFGFDSFLRFEGEGDTEISLQEKAVNAALDNKSFLVVFPTGGGKSLTFQLPALMKGEACRSLTVVISPLQSLMKDQVDILKDRHERTDAAAVSGLLSPLERAEAVDKVESGAAHILYISPESLRSNTILRLLHSRTIERFVVDEAHCFSSWGQDFRVDYQYIGEFLKQLIKQKGLSHPIPVSCFTATAKPSVIRDIKDYFQKRLGVELEVFQTAPKRKNLSYGIYYAADSREKFSLLLDLLARDHGPKIVYTTRVKRSEMLAEKLREHGFNAAPYNGRMDSEQKIKIQDDFMTGAVDIIVATSAFGMGIDKDDVSMVVHYNISDSLENYLQEAGRAGRNKEIKANCYVLFDDTDLMGHFNLLNSTRLNKKEIYQVWQGIKKMRKKKFSRSALEIARAAGWDAELHGWETRLKTALAALEDCGLIKRGQDQTRILATGLLVKNMAEASALIQEYEKFAESDRLHAARIIKFIISHKECAVDAIADTLGIPKHDTHRLILELKGLKIIGDDKDLTAFIDTGPRSKTNSLRTLERFARLETRFLEYIKGDEHVPAKKIALKEINTYLRENGVDSDIESLRTILFTWETRKSIEKKRLDRQNHIYLIRFKKPPPAVQSAVSQRLELARRVLNKLFIDSRAGAAHEPHPPGGDNPGEPGETRGTGTLDTLVEFSVNELKRFVESDPVFEKNFAITDYDKILLYLNEISALKLHRGLFVFYSPYTITRCDMDNKRLYTGEDYKKFETFYRHKIEQIHIVGEYARKLARNYHEAMIFIEDYFSLDYPLFIKKYFPRRLSQIQKPITEKRFKEIFKDLSPEQLSIINDNQSRVILVAAGPGSGKTRVLVHKVASLLTLEDIKTEQFLMLTYSRAAALEMKERLRELIKQTANYIDIYTFHSFAFSLAELKGDLEQSAGIIPRAVELIKSGPAAHKVENKSVLVIDEFQDIGSDEFALIRAIIEAAREIRVLAVGDDDQNIFEFRGSSVQYMNDFKNAFNASVYPLNTNYRSKSNLVQFSNSFIKRLPNRIKDGQDLVSAFPAENGQIIITQYQSPHLVVPLVKDAAGFRARSRDDRNGTAAVLTATNEEALQVYTLLRQQGIAARLLVSYAGFSLKNLVELKIFSHLIGNISQGSDDKIIEREAWDTARKQIMKKFSRSGQLELALAVIDSFEKSCDHLLAINWQEYLDEIMLEDFIFPDKETVFVSTMHKAKGKEFDHVFLLLDNYKMVKDENIRVVYVAVTRARERLSIHTNRDIFGSILVPGEHRLFDDNAYTEPDHLSFQLTHRDVFLDFFTNDWVIEAVRSLQAGDRLTLSKRNPNAVTHRGKEILRFSTGTSETIRKFLDRGYRIASIHAEYIVVWWKKEEDKWYRVVLPRLELEKD